MWLSDVPLDANDCARGDVLLAVDFDMVETEVSDFEVVEEGRGFREWLMPAAVVNGRGSAHVATGEEEEEGDAERWTRAEQMPAGEEWPALEWRHLSRNLALIARERVSPWDQWLFDVGCVKTW